MEENSLGGDDLLFIYIFSHLWTRQPFLTLHNRIGEVLYSTKLIQTKTFYNSVAILFCGTDLSWQKYFRYFSTIFHVRL